MPLARKSRWYPFCGALRVVAILVVGCAPLDESAKRAELDREIWAQEVLAQRYEEPFVALWDRLRTAHDARPVLASFPCEEIVLAAPGDPQALDFDVTCRELSGPPQEYTPDSWKKLLDTWHAAGFRLVQSEWHHARFQIADNEPRRSTVSTVLHVENEKTSQRLIIAGDLDVAWRARSGDEAPVAARIDASRLRIWQRSGIPPFRLAATLPAPDEEGRDFLAVYDLDGDGDAEILFGNHRYRNDGNGQFVAEPLAQHRSDPLVAGVLADFNGDGRVDLLCADSGRSPELFLADATGRFASRPRTVSAVPPLKLPMAVTAGDVNGDGHLDAWITQYRQPYRDGQMPTPYFDANDGFPSHLILGDGTGKFRSATAAAGLAAKRLRRTYSSSLVDLDGDRDLDLLVVSDFAGIDLYQNDGQGRFTDVTETWLDEWHTFGMSHVLDDWNGDGRPDLFVTGMGSTTARRLDAMQLGRPEFERHNRMRAIMGYGNRLFLATGSGIRATHYREPEFRASVARTGWSWGVTSADFDNDGDRDLYVGNGHISGPSVRDYCSTFWRHDIYTGDSEPDRALADYFRARHDGFQQFGSWNGYEHNCLLVNQQDRGFVNLAFLLGVAHEFDTRNVVGSDFDLDGRVDLLIVENPAGGPSILHVIGNRLESDHAWIGLQLVDRPGRSPLGAVVTLHTADGAISRPLVTGDSFKAQHPAAVHFGLGGARSVEAIEIRWPDGESETLANPAAGQYHLLR